MKVVKNLFIPKKSRRIKPTHNIYHKIQKCKWQITIHFKNTKFDNQFLYDKRFCTSPFPLQEPSIGMLISTAFIFSTEESRTDLLTMPWLLLIPVWSAGRHNPNNPGRLISLMECLRVVFLEVVGVVVIFELTFIDFEDSFPELLKLVKWIQRHW